MEAFIVDDLMGGWTGVAGALGGLVNGGVSRAHGAGIILWVLEIKVNLTEKKGKLYQGKLIYIVTVHTAAGRGDKTLVFSCSVV